jgi:hypothetical protein
MLIKCSAKQVTLSSSPHLMEFVAVLKISKHFIENSKVGVEDWVSRNC